MEIGDIVREYRAKVNRAGEVETDITENKIIAINDEYICVDNYCFRTFQKKGIKDKSILYPTIDNISISDWSDFKWLDHLFTVSLYTVSMSQKAVSGKMTREFKKYLDKKLSVYLYNVDVKISF